MKTFTIFALLLSTLPASPSANAARLEGGLHVQKEVIEIIRWENFRCEKGAFTSSEMDRENHISEDEISARLLISLNECAAITERRQNRLKQGVLNAANIPLDKDGDPRADKVLELLDKNEIEFR